jgi:hypothetical protein
MQRCPTQLGAPFDPQKVSRGGLIALNGATTVIPAEAGT